MNSETSNRVLTVGLLGASLGTKNLGVSALTCGTVASIFHSYPNARLFLVDYAIEPATYQISHPGGVAMVELINIRFSKRFYLRNNIAYLLLLALLLKVLPSRKWRIWIQRENQVLKTLLEADIICSIAGGDSFSDIYGFGRLIYVALPQILVQLLDKPLVLLPQTLGPFKSTLAKAIARSIVRRSRMVYTRDIGGLGAVRCLVGSDHGRLEFAYDMGFALEPHIEPERIPSWLSTYDKSTPLVGLNVSGLLYIGGYTRSNMFGIKADYRRLIYGLINFFVRKHSAHVMLVPHVFGAGEDSESDVIACRNIYNSTEDGLRAHMHLLDKEYDQHEIKALIGRCDFFMGSRMHACIASISQGVPAVCLAYSKKFLGVFQSVGIQELVIDIREKDEKEVITIVHNAYERRKELHNQLEVTIPAVKNSVLNLFSTIPIEPYQREGPRQN